MTTNKPKISLAPEPPEWRKSPPEAPVLPPTPKPAAKAELTYLDAATITKIVAIIDRINLRFPLNHTAIMRGIGKGPFNFRWYFSSDSKRASEESLNNVASLFDCPSAEAFFALHPDSPGLKETIERKHLSRSSWRKLQNK